ncbi:hypothetical protein FPANT_6859 [Fusarium pseudoanthophilum]|uniref:Peptidase S8/S53 domain-containing protein n=1 Tax=Fusarium pseudoanthophilum TaxID=48495 RepID=A0A8H5P2M0_9HYPO|nr:hypothetical protein FPANT_6859 [Fusarium pseudoanthophilum]
MSTLHPTRLEKDDAKKVFDELEKEILSFSGQIFQSELPLDSSQATFTVSERVDAGPDSFPEEVVICPEACLHEFTISKPKAFKCRCCCVGEPHTDNLTYRHSKEVETFAKHLSSHWSTLSSEPGLFEPKMTEMTQNDWGFPSDKVQKVEIHSFNTTTLLPEKSNPKVKQFGILQSPYPEKNAGQRFPPSVLPQSHFCILLSRLKKDDCEVRDTQIYHETNPHGRLVVTLKKAIVHQVMASRQHGNDCDIDFHFGERGDAQLFTAYLKAAQDRLREMFVHGPMENEQILDSRLFEPDSGIRAQALIPAEDDSKTKCRRYLKKGLSKSLQDVGVWISDYDANGKSIVSKMSWEEFTRRGTRSQNLRATFSERPMRSDRTDRHERVKIAIIDSGLHDRERGRYEAKYKDFTGIPTNDSWHGTCCAWIIRGIYEEARLYIARIFENNHVDEIEGPLRMAKAIHWAIEPPCSVDIISISAGFRNYSKELCEAVTRARAAGVLVVAAASNWRNTRGVAYPAFHSKDAMCIYSTNTGNQSSSFNPEPHDPAQNFAILGEGFQHPDQSRNEQMSGTSMATAVAVGLAASILDFSRQEDNKDLIPRAQDVGNLRYVSPHELLPKSHGVSRAADRERIRFVLSRAMEKAK